MTDYNNLDILVVEDNDDDFMLLERALQKTGKILKYYRVDDGEKALHYLFAQGEYQKRNPEDLPKMLLVDLKLPKYTGIEIAEHVRKNPQTQVVPTIIFSSSTMPSDIRNAYQAGVNSYVVKPIGFKNIIDKLDLITSYWLNANYHLPK
jgi:CheY-like chemotaxis protein